MAFITETCLPSETTLSLVNIRKQSAGCLSISLVKIFEGSLRIFEDLHEDLCEDLDQDL